MRSSKPFRVLLVSLAVFALTFVVSQHLRATDDIQWKQIGPGGGGNMLSSGVSPANANIVLMGGDVGGILRSGDGGLTWTLANQAMIDPARFMGYGAYGHFEWDTVSTNIVYKGHLKSTDSGVSFKVNIDESDVAADSSLVDSANHLVVYAFGYGNVYRSSDGFESTSCVKVDGTSCSPNAPSTTCSSKTRCYQRTCLPDPITGIATCPNYNDRINDLVQDKDAPLNLLACAKTGLYKSTDGATTWTKVTGLPFSSCQAMALNYKAQGHVKTIYLLVPTTPIKGVNQPGVWTDIDTWQGGVYKSTNFGTSWTAVNGSDEANVLTNPGFETTGDAQHPAAGWLSGGATVTRDTVEHHGGGASIKVVFAGDGGEVSADPPLTVQGGELYKLSGWFKSDSSTGYPVNINAWFYDAQQQPLEFPGVYWYWVSPISFHATTPTTYEWRRMEGMFRVPDGARSMAVTVGANYGNGTAWFDDFSLAKTHTLPRTTGDGGSPYFTSYYDIAVDPTDANIVYVGSERGTWSDSAYADQGGLWKTSDGGTTWSLVTRHQWHDNIRDSTVPECGDNVCGGKWETCNTCPVDCTGPTKPVPPACCGDGTCAAPAENYDNCLADCPFDPDPNHGAGYEVASYYEPANGNTYYAARANGNGSQEVWTISVGSGTTGHLTIYEGGEHLKSTDGGATWTELSTVPYTGGDSQAGTAQARGGTNDIYGLFVVTDNRQGLNRLYFGDTDGLLQVSYNGGKSFAEEGWQWPPWNISPWAPSAGVVGDAASSLVLDPSDPNRVYVGMNVMSADVQGYDPTANCCGGAVQGVFTPGTPPAVGRWAWTPLGNQSTFPKGIGGTELLRTTTSGNFFASILSRGVYRLDANNDWVNTWDGNSTNSNWNPVPSLWLTHRMVEEPASGRLYVGLGHLINLTVPSGESGVWESTDSGATWHRITDPGDNTGTGMDQESVMDMALDGPNTLFVATWYGYHNVGDGGLYKGTRDTITGAWTWAKVLSQPMVSGITVSPASSSILYALAGQICCSGTIVGQQAGLYKSVNGGNTWSPVVNNGLMNIGMSKLSFSSSDSHKVYASTIGDGIFEGTISCGPPSEGFPDADGDGVPDCAFTNIAEQVTPTTGFVISGNYPALSCATLPDSEEKLREQTTGSKRKLIKVWKLDNVPVGKQLELWVDGYRTPGGGGAADDFKFSLTTKVAGSSCTNSDGVGSPLLTLTNQSNNNVAQIVNVGVISNPVVCLRVEDSNQASDSQTDDLTLDRVCLRGLP